MRPPRSVGQDVRTVFWQLLLSLLRKDRGPGPVHRVKCRWAAEDKFHSSCELARGGGRRRRRWLAQRELLRRSGARCERPVGTARGLELSQATPKYDQTNSSSNNKRPRTPQLLDNAPEY